MQRVSSNYTILLKLFIPTVWLVFFGLFTLATLFIENEDNPFFNTTQFKIGTVVFYLVGAAFLYFTFLKLKRVDFGEDHFLVSNYFKTFKYYYKDVVTLKVNNYIILKTMHLKLRGKGSFGKKITFLPQSKYLSEFLGTHPGLIEVEQSE
jgi:hypothetical protein